MAARLAAYDPSDDKPRAAGAAASTDQMVLDPVDEGAAPGAPEISEPAPKNTTPHPAAPFLVPEADLAQEADDLPLENEEAVEDSPLANQGEEVQPKEREQSGQGAAEGAPREVIGNLILGEATEQPSSPEEELIDNLNHPLLEPEPDWEQSGTEATVQNAEEDAVQNSPPERSRSGDSGERVATADPIPPLSAQPADPDPCRVATIRHDRAGVWQLVAAQQSGMQPEAHYLQIQRQSHCQ